MDINQITAQITEHIGPFILYGGVLVVAMLIATYFINTFRGILVAVFILASVYYIFVASPQQRKAMDAYATNLYSSIIGQNVGKVTESVKSALKEKYEEGASGVKELYQKSGETENTNNNANQ